MSNQIPILINHDMALPVGFISFSESIKKDIYKLLKTNSIELSCTINSSTKEIVAISLVPKNGCNIKIEKKNKLSRLQVLGIAETIEEGV